MKSITIGIILFVLGCAAGLLYPKSPSQSESKSPEISSFVYDNNSQVFVSRSWINQHIIVINKSGENTFINNLLTLKEIKPNAIVVNARIYNSGGIGIGSSSSGFRYDEVIIPFTDIGCIGLAK